MRPFLCLSLAILLAADAWGQRFELVEPSGLVSAAVEVRTGRLLVLERSGERIHFSREARYDSADGRFVGYFNFELNRVLRFPRSGSGLLQSADLDDLTPRFRNTIRIVRPVGAIADQHAIARPWQSQFNGPIFMPGYVDPYVSGYSSAGPLAQAVLIDSQTIPNPPLGDARILLRNDGPREIQVAVVDLKEPSGTRSMRIRPAEAAEVLLARDAGGQRVANYRVVTQYGESIIKEVRTDIPAPIRYEVVVHEWAMQSIAIDRTGKSPNLIEDINFQGRGLGRFPLPPGPQLQSGTIDVYRAARSRGNAAAIAPIVPRDDRPADSASPLERAILEAQRAAQGN